MSAVQTSGDVVSLKAARAARPRAVSKPPARKRRATVKVLPSLHKAEMRTIGQFIAALAASFLPIASYVIAHQEVATREYMWVLVGAALLFSAPTLAEWAQRWCSSPYKAWGFCVLLEGTMVFSSTVYLGYAGLAVLVAINCHSAWHLAGKSMRAKPTETATSDS